MSARGAPLDWEAAHARLGAVRRALDAGGAREPEEAARVLARRAAALAAPRPEAPAPGGTLELLVFDVARGRYGVETGHVHEVFALDGLAPLPGVPAFLRGVVNHRGRILPVIDLGGLFGQAREGEGEGARVVAVEVGAMRFGLAADAVVGITPVAGRELAPPPPAGAEAPFVRGVTGELVAVLALEALAQRIVVDDEGGRAALKRGDAR